MIYCLGDPKIYDTQIDENPPLFKAGKSRDYPGGTVWQFKDNAELCGIDYPNWKVYGVMASWFTDTEELNDNSLPGGRSLLFNSLIVRLD